MKANYTNLVLKYILLGGLFFSLMLFIPTQYVRAEGSGIWGNGVIQQPMLWHASYSNTIKGGFGKNGYMMLPSSSGRTGTGEIYNENYDPGHRLYVYLKKGETAYFGFHTDGDIGSWRVRWYYDSTDSGFFPDARNTAEGRYPATFSYENGGTTANKDFSPSGSGTTQGRIESVDQATAGPSQLGISGGYNSHYFTNTSGQDRAFWIEITDTSDRVINSTAGFNIDLWDITVANYANQIQSGRVYSKFWSISNSELTSTMLGSGLTNRLPASFDSIGSNFGFYIPVENSFSSELDDYFVKRISLARVSKGQTNFFANETGPGSTDNYLENRKSKVGESKNYQYPLFLSNPDPTIWKTSAQPTAAFAINFKERAYPNNGGEAVLNLTISMPGIVDVLVDLNSNDVYDEGVDIILSKKFSNPGTFQIIWDGLDPKGNKIPLGAKVNFKAAVSFFPVHFPIFDLEHNSGVRISNVRPGAEADNLMNWDDSALPTNTTAGLQNTANPKVNVTGIQEAGHVWGSGKNVTMNTWAASHSTDIQEKSNFNFMIINGDVFDDYNGQDDDRVNGSPSSARPIFVTLISNETNTVSSVASVRSNGTYSLKKVGNGSYRILLRTDSTALGAADPGVLIPEFWENTGENHGAGPGHDGLADGILTGIMINGSSTYRANFGLRPISSDVQVASRVDNDKPEFGSSVIFTISASNKGYSPAKDVQVLEHMPKGYSYLSHSTSAGTYDTATNLWKIGTVPMDTILTLILIARVEENESDYLSKVVISSSTPDSDLENNSAEVATSPFNATPLASLFLTGQPIGEQVLLEWEITDVENTAHFDIERSPDGENWEGLSRVPVYEYSTSFPHYELKDPKPRLGNNYYRLKLITLDQRESISDIIKVTIEPTWTLTAYPNPSANQIMIRAKDAEQMNLSIFDSNGKAIRPTLLESGTDYIKLDLRDLTNGVYLVQLTDNWKILSKKIIKMN